MNDIYNCCKLVYMLVNSSKNETMSWFVIQKQNLKILGLNIEALWWESMDWKSSSHAFSIIQVRQCFYLVRGP